MLQDERIVVASNNMDESATQKCSSMMKRRHGGSGNLLRFVRSGRQTTWTKTVPSSLSLTLIILLQFVSIISGQSTTTEHNDETECVCSPRQFFFKLNLSAICPPLPPPFPPNEVFGSGVKDYTCSIGPEPVQNDAGELILDGEEVVEPTGDESESNNTSTTNSSVSTDSTSTSTRRLRQRRYRMTQESSTGVGTKYNATASDYFPEVDLQWSSINFTASGLTTEVDVTPVVIYSIQFLEVDTSFNVINQDSAYVRGIDFVSGDVFNYTSVSSTRRGVVPGGMNMVLRGVNAKGDPVRNVFTITYTNECGVPTFQKGDAIGWVVFENFEQASEETCGALTAAPSIGGVAKETSPPSKSPSSPSKSSASPSKSPSSPSKSSASPSKSPSSPSKSSASPSKSPSSFSSSKIPTSDDYLYPGMSYSYASFYGSKSAKAKSSKKGGSKGGKSENYKSTDGSDGWQRRPSKNTSYHYGKRGSSRPEPYYRALLRDALLTEIRLDRHDHRRRRRRDRAEPKKTRDERIMVRQSKINVVVGQEVRR